MTHMNDQRIKELLKYVIGLRCLSLRMFKACTAGLFGNSTLAMCLQSCQTPSKLVQLCVGLRKQ